MKHFLLLQLYHILVARFLKFEILMWGQYFASTASCWVAPAATMVVCVSPNKQPSLVATCGPITDLFGQSRSKIQESFS